MNRIEEWVFAVLRSWWTWYLLSWAALVLGSGVALHYAWNSFDNSITGNARPDGNSGHATIDFGGQWIMGRLLVAGHGRDLYNRSVQRTLLTAAYPDADQEPGKSDVDNLMYWVMGSDDPRSAEAAAPFVLPLTASDPLQAASLVAAGPELWTQERVDLATTKRVGGPLYPPVNAFLNAPLALMTPRTAYHVQQVFNLLLVYVAATGLHRLVGGRIWWPLLAFALLVFPGFAGSINLGQNATLTLTIVVWGWVFAAEDRPIPGGLVWGLLAFKPVWALSFFLVPLLSRRYRFAAAMVTSGTAIAALTLPFVGIQSWLDWLEIGRDAAKLYNVEENWIFLSRDLLGVPRRYLIDFKNTPLFERNDNWLAKTLIGWSLLAVAFEVTVRVTVFRCRRPVPAVGPPAAFLFLGAWLCCYHFMYYDVLLGALPIALLWSEPARFLQPMVVAILPTRLADLPASLATTFGVRLPADAMPEAAMLRAPEGRSWWLLNRMAPTAVAVLVSIHYLFPVVGLGTHWGPPWDTMCLALVWAWSGLQWMRHGDRVAVDWRGPPTVEKTIEAKGDCDWTGP